MMKSTLLDSENAWKTNLGAFIFGTDKIYLRGKNLLKDFSDYSWLQLYVYALTGKKINQDAATTIEKMMLLSISYPDPRLWINRIAALAGSSRSTISLAVGAALPCSEGPIFGLKPCLLAADFLLRIDNYLKSGKSLEEAIRLELAIHKVIKGGYGRPLGLKNDERIEPVEAIFKKYGFYDGHFVSLSRKIEQQLIKMDYKSPKRNIAVSMVGLGLDIGIPPKVIASIVEYSFLAGALPCYFDALNKMEGTFFPIRCSSIRYLGKGARKLTIS